MTGEVAMPKVTLTIDGKSIQADRGAFLLDVCRQQHIPIPTLCNNDALGSDGRCRLCVVEVKRGNRTRMVTSCLFPVAEGVEAVTTSPNIMLVRRTVLELLWARCPGSEEIARLARQHGVREVRYRKDNDKGKCILCNLCIRTCEVVVGVSALGLSGNGPSKKVTTPFDEPSDTCIGCGACAFVCPTGHIVMWEKEGVRNIWGRKFEMAACLKCGRHFAPHYQLEFIAKTTGVGMERLQTCQDCR